MKCTCLLVVELPLSAQRAAKAYDLVRDVVRTARCEDPDELGKYAGLAVREVLVLQICGLAGSLSDIGFENALVNAFESAEILSPERLRDMRLARSAIARLGRDRFIYDRAVPKIFSSRLSDPELDALFLAYAECANSITRT